MAGEGPIHDGAMMAIRKPAMRCVCEEAAGGPCEIEKSRLWSDRERHSYEVEFFCPARLTDSAGFPDADSSSPGTPQINPPRPLTRPHTCAAWITCTKTPNVHVHVHAGTQQLSQFSRRSQTGTLDVPLLLSILTPIASRCRT